MFRPGDRGKLMNYLKKTSASAHQIISDDGNNNQAATATAKHRQQKYNKNDDSNHRGRVLSSTSNHDAAADEDVNGNGNEHGASKKSKKKKQKTNKLRQSVDQIGTVEDTTNTSSANSKPKVNNNKEITTSIKKKKSKKNKNKMNKPNGSVENNNDNIAASDDDVPLSSSKMSPKKLKNKKVAIEQQPPPRNAAKRNRRQRNEQLLMQDVQNMVANFDPDKEEQTFEDYQADFEAADDDVDDDQDAYDVGDGDEDYYEEEEQEVPKVIQKQPQQQQQPPKKKAKLNDHNPKDDGQNSEMARRSTELGQKARATLATSMFRSLNEFLYCHDSNQTRREFTASKFQMYHQAYDKLMDDWPLKPIDYLINVLRERIPEKKIIKTTIADVGCGSRPRIAEAFPSATVHSYDLHQSDPSDLRIISADMSRLPLDSEQCDFVVYSLSLMATNLKDCVREANRILKMGGYMLVVEVSSRFADYQCTSGRQCDQEKHVGHRFGLDLKSYGFQLTDAEELKPNGFFVYLAFKKTGNAETMGPKSKMPALTLKACVYKAR